jgi:MYXO-CTERM domain-containing protein
MALTKKVIVNALLGATLLAASARASFVVSIEQIGANVVASGKGSIDTNSLTAVNSGTSLEAGMDSNAAFLTLGGAPFASWRAFETVIGPTNFGTGGTVFTPSSTGDLVSLQSGQAIVVPADYVSGAALSASATFADTTLADLGLTVGQGFAWNWGTGADADSITLNIVSSTPEPLPLALVALGLLGVGLLRRSKL